MILSFIKNTRSWVLLGQWPSIYQITDKALTQSPSTHKHTPIQNKTWAWERCQQSACLLNSGLCIWFPALQSRRERKLLQRTKNEKTKLKQNKTQPMRADLCFCASHGVSHTVADTVCTLFTVRTASLLTELMSQKNTQVKGYEFYVYNSYSHWAFLKLFLSVSSTE